jgi:hypothetical protein
MDVNVRFLLAISVLKDPLQTAEIGLTETNLSSLTATTLSRNTCTTNQLDEWRLKVERHEHIAYLLEIRRQYTETGAEKSKTGESKDILKDSEENLP